MTEPMLQFNLDGEWVDLPSVNYRIDTRAPAVYTEAEQHLMRELVKEFIEAEGCTLADVRVQTVRDFGARYFKVWKK